MCFVNIANHTLLHFNLVHGSSGSGTVCLQKADIIYIIPLQGRFSLTLKSLGESHALTHSSQPQLAFSKDETFFFLLPVVRHEEYNLKTMKAINSS